MDDLKRALLFHRAIDSSTMEAILRLSALFIDLFADLHTFKIIYTRLSQLPKERPPLIVFEQYVCTVLQQITPHRDIPEHD